MDGPNYRHWNLAFRDPYPLLIAFGCILFVCWLITGIVGMLVNTAFKAKVVSPAHAISAE